MSSSDPAFGWMLRQFVGLGVLKLKTEPLDAAIERRLKQFWESTTCPKCGNPTIRTWKSSDRIHCHSCQFKRIEIEGRLSLTREENPQGMGYKSNLNEFWDDTDDHLPLSTN